MGKVNGGQTNRANNHPRIGLHLDFKYILYLFSATSMALSSR